MIRSKLPNTGTTIFTTMSQLAMQHDAVNLSQGFPDFEVSPQLIEMVGRHMKRGHNQYAPMPGLHQLRDQISQKIHRSYGVSIDPNEEITVTGGATEALYCAITALVHPGDEVIIFEPAYDSYEPVIELCGGKIIRIPLEFPSYNIPWDLVRNSLSQKTKLMIINSPHNPTGSVLSKEDYDQAMALAASHDLFLLSDEVYEHIVFDGNQHHSVLSYPEHRDRVIAVYSFGKTFHATGWKVGYMVASQPVTKELRKLHQFLNFSVNTPIQWALAEYLENPQSYESVSPLYQKKKDLFLQVVESSAFKPLKTSGTYFQLLSYQQIDSMSDYNMAVSLTEKNKIASIPISVFYHDKTDHRLLRFCFAKTDETLEKAGEILCRI